MHWCTIWVWGLCSCILLPWDTRPLWPDAAWPKPGPRRRKERTCFPEHIREVETPTSAASRRLFPQGGPSVHKHGNMETFCLMPKNLTKRLQLTLNLDFSPLLHATDDKWRCLRTERQLLLELLRRSCRPNPCPHFSSWWTRGSSDRAWLAHRSAEVWWRQPASTLSSLRDKVPTPNHIIHIPNYHSHKIFIQYWQATPKGINEYTFVQFSLDLVYSN